jgi:hypothetical protein
VKKKNAYLVLKMEQVTVWLAMTIIIYQLIHPIKKYVKNVI